MSGIINQRERFMDVTCFVGYILQVNETYNTLYLKTRALWTFIGERVNSTFSHCQYFIKIDEDSYVNFPLLKDTLSCRDPMTPLYSGFYGFGRSGFKRGRNGPTVKVVLAYGCAYLISRGVAMHLQDWIHDYVYIERERNPGEDYLFTVMLKLHGICYDNIIGWPYISMEYTQIDLGRQKPLGSHPNVNRILRLLDGNRPHKNCFLFIHKLPAKAFPLINSQVNIWRTKYGPCKAHACHQRQIDRNFRLDFDQFAKEHNYSSCNPETSTELHSWKRIDGIQ
mmetsp:Transcript_4639/g.6926  ORF Transcript_4639/g.6926 Transcript_4639/m.6926 type:complete len:281 (-) Transcript_4639:30-872(-)